MVGGRLTSLSKGITSCKVVLVPFIVDSPVTNVVSFIRHSCKDTTRRAEAGEAPVMAPSIRGSNSHLAKTISGLSLSMLIVTTSFTED